MPTPELQLLVRIVDGDPEASAWLFDRFAPRLLRRLAMRYRELDAEELLQDAFLLCFRDDAAIVRRALERLAPEETTEPAIEQYLWDQACGLAANRRRSLSRRGPLVPFEERRGAGGVDPERTSLARDTLGKLARCLGDGRPRVYLYFKLRYVDGLEPVEISQATGWSRKATYKLKESLNEAVRSCAERLEIDIS